MSLGESLMRAAPKKSTRLSLSGWQLEPLEVPLAGAFSGGLTSVPGSRKGLRAQILTGEFDPGSERTLAARLTHASRTRKGFGPGTVAHG